VRRFGLDAPSPRLSRGTGEVRFSEGDHSDQRDAASYAVQDGLVHPAPSIPPSRTGVDARHPYADWLHFSAPK
jgi:hypothetical protein